MRGDEKRRYVVEAIVVAVVLLLLLVVMLPKFKGAQERTDVVRARRDMKDIGDALILYCKDHGEYLPTQSGNPLSELEGLLQPIAYLEAMPTDPFRRIDSAHRSATSNYDYSRDDYVRFENSSDIGQGWVLGSLGPDLDEEAGLFGRPQPQLMYHVSNGVMSSGDLYWSAYDCDAIILRPTPIPRFMP